ncbi:hypothetical protein ACQKLP_05030 [Chitinophaga sp. NPDC101104]|uniref:hypothetical protein n=1 Tax=Chitinophaga sp. NPDC101104 TaxID=3390561 RepID=UPI003D02880B
MEEHYLNEEELKAIKLEMGALEQQKGALIQRILNHFNTRRAKRERMIKNGFIEEDGSPSMRWADTSRWRTLEEYWNRNR